MLNILIVDDEAPIREWIAYCIEKAGENYNVIGTAKSGREALEIILEQKPNVVITDIKMPGMDGIELMQSVKKVLPYTTFVILTNYAEFSYAKKAISYGAVEYLLKSELRSVDLVNVLEKILKNYTALLEGKNNEILSSGYVDLYSLYQNLENKNYLHTFWEGMGMDINKPYCLIGVFEDPTCNQRERIIKIANETAPFYFNAAFRQQIIFIIIQEETVGALNQKVNSFVRKYFNETQQYVAIGKIQENLDSFMKAIEQIQSTLSCAFFKSPKGVFSYNDLMQVKELDRNEIREKYRKILSMISLKQYESAINAINSWFDNFLDINVNDIIWAKGMCIKLFISIEERFYQLNSEYEYSSKEAQLLKSSDICKEECLHMIEKMITGKNGVRSKSISEALDFIHVNYNQDISLIKVANHVYRSPEYFSRLFKEEVGTNFSVYLMMYRLSCADQMLKANNVPISQIAYEVGYTNPGYFSRIYKKYMGMTPEEARGQKSANKSK